MPKFLWTQRSNFGPSARLDLAMAYDSNRGRTVLFGGRPPADGSAPLGDTWEWDGSYWTQVDDFGPPARVQHAMVYDSVRKVTILFGGNSGSGTNTSALGDTWQWDGQNWTQLSNSGPSARVSHAMAFDATRNQTVLFGGADATGPLQDTWQFDGQDWTRLENSGPSPRSYHAMAYDAVNARVTLFGGGVPANGAAGNSVLGDTWAWDGNTWVQIATFGPSARQAAAMVWMGDTTLLFGGIGVPSLLGDTWEFDGKLWSQRQDIGPGARSDHGMTFDTARNRVVLFGGTNASGGANVPLGDTWEHEEDQTAATPPVSSVSVTSVQAAVAGQIVTITIFLSGPAPAGGAVVHLSVAASGDTLLPSDVTAPAGSTGTQVQLNLQNEVPGGTSLVISANTDGTPPATATVTV